MFLNQHNLIHNLNKDTKIESNCVCVCVCICGVEKNYQSRVEAALDQALRVPFKIRGHVAGEERNQAQTEEH